MADYNCTPSQAQNFYGVLGLPKTASPEEIKKKFRKLAVRWHPDKNPNNFGAAEENFKKINEAYDTLSDPEKKRDYDHYLKWQKHNRYGTGQSYHNDSSSKSHTSLYNGSSDYNINFGRDFSSLWGKYSRQTSEVQDFVESFFREPEKLFRTSSMDFYSACNANGGSQPCRRASTTISKEGRTTTRRMTITREKHGGIEHISEDDTDIGSRSSWLEDPFFSLI